MVSIGGEEIAAGQGGGLIEVISLRSARSSRTLRLHRMDISYICKHREFDREHFPYLYSCGDDNKVVLVNIRNM